MRCIIIGDHYTSEACAVQPHDRGLLLGDGVFDTIVVRDGHPLYLNAHLRRLQRAAASIGIDCSIKADEIRQAMSSCPPTGVLRISISRGVGGRGLWPGQFAQAMPHALFFPGLPLADQPLRFIISSMVRNERSPLSRIKSLSNLEAVLAMREAQASGADEALLYNTSGNLSCAAAGNIIYQLPNDPRFYTPPIKDGALPGITLAVLRRRLSITDRTSPRAELPYFTSVLITNSVRGVCRADFSE